MSDRDYCYPPAYIVLRNRLDIRDARVLEAAERQLVAQRLVEPVPTGDFDLAHLKAIHRHLFQDVYAWAGEVRTVEIAKGESRFQPTRFIAAGMADVHRRIVAAGYFRESGPDGFAERAGPVIGDVNHVHPFREGNGRTQFQYLKQLAARAGHAIDLTRIDRAAWLEASRHSSAGDHAAIARCIRAALVNP
ncbi:MAG: Fic family protein [Alphaproteobacteria bacterium]|nr:Fic family protein [Alphaproteobacteria bacterium]